MIAITLRKIRPRRWGMFEEIKEVIARIIGGRCQTMTCVPVYLTWGIVDPYEIVGHDSARYSSVFHLIACRSDDTHVLKMLIEFDPYVLQEAWFVNGEIPGRVAKHEKFTAELIAARKQPPRLDILCRFNIIQQLGYYPLQNAGKLPLPRALREFVQLKKLEGFKMI